MNKKIITHKIILLMLVVFAASAKAQQPDVFNAARIKSTMLKVAGWQLNHHNGKPENTWTNGAFYTGVFAAFQATRSGPLLDSIKAMGDRNQWLPARRFDHADDIAISQTYIDMYRLSGNKMMIQPTIDSVRKMMTVEGDQIKKHGLTWWWCVALFMAPPTLAKLSKTLKDPSYLVAADTLFRQTYRLLYDQAEHLFARDASYLLNENGEGKKEANGKKIFWSRGNGWVLAGLARWLQEMPKDYKGRPFYVDLFKQMSNRLITLQQPDGLWRTSLLDPASYPGGEGSGSGFFCFALAWGINQKMLDRETFTPVVKRAWVGLNTLVTAEGKVGWVQPIGADPRKNFDAESWESYGAGAFLLGGAEVIRLKK